MIEKPNAEVVVVSSTADFVSGVEGLEKEADQCHINWRSHLLRQYSCFNPAYFGLFIDKAIYIPLPKVATCTYTGH